MHITADLSGLPLAVRERVVKSVRHEDAAQYALAQLEQARAAAFYRGCTSAGAHGGVGRLTSAVHVGIKHFLAKLHGHAIVHEDPEYLPWLLKHHEEFRVPDGRQRVGIGFTPNLNRTPAPAPSTRMNGPSKIKSVLSSGQSPQLSTFTNLRHT